MKISNCRQVSTPTSSRSFFAKNSAVQTEYSNCRPDPMPQSDLFSALQSSTDSIDTEFKSVRGSISSSLWESYSSMQFAGVVR